MAIRILTDSTADLTAQQAADLNVEVIPLKVMFGTQEFLDGVTISVEEFYEKMVSSAKLPTTSQPSPAQFLAHFEAAQEAQDEVIVLTISSAISGTYQSANIAKETCGYEKIYLIDTATATLGAQLLVLLAVKLRQQGLSAQEIALELETQKYNICLLAFVDDLKYLKRGGRLSGAGAVAGTLLGIKPIVEVAEGKVVVAGKARGLPGAYVNIFKLMETRGGVDEAYPVCVGYTGERQSVEPFYRYITNNLKLSKPYISPIGSVIGVHAGPGAGGIAFFKKNK
ncbi:MAG: DegV family protein [Oscillospiraceae bacterium]|nr:DegV family protein [Oscillospiraceae bacterium]